MKRRILAMILAMVIAFSFVACGNSTETNVSDENIQEEKTSEEDDRIYFSEFFSPQANAICYCIEDEGAKDSVIFEVYAFKDGQAFMYPLKELGIKVVLGEVARMTDDEILAMLDKKVEEVYNKEIEACNQLLAMDMYSDYTSEDGITYTGLLELKEAFEEYKENLKNFDAKEEFSLTEICYEVYTDDTGNYAEDEYVRWQQNGRYVSNVGIAQWLLRDYSENDIREGVLGIWLDCDFRDKIRVTMDDDGTTLTDCEIRYTKDAEEVCKRVSYAARSSLYDGTQQVYDAYFGGFVMANYYLIARSPWDGESYEDTTYYEGDTIETADVVDPQ